MATFISFRSCFCAAGSASGRPRGRGTREALRTMAATQGCKARINGRVVVVVSLMTHDGRLMNDELGKWMHHFHLYSISLVQCLSSVLLSDSVFSSYLFISFFCFPVYLVFISLFSVLFSLPSLFFLHLVSPFLLHSPLISFHHFHFVFHSYY